MKNLLIFLMAFFILVMGACGISKKDKEADGINEAAIIEEIKLSSKTKKEVLEESPSKIDRNEIILEKPIWSKKKVKRPQFGKIDYAPPKKVEVFVKEKEQVEADKDDEESPDPEEVEEAVDDLIIKEELVVEAEVEAEVHKEVEKYVFEPYYSAPIGSHGLFSDSDCATQEGWRISEMDDPSGYLGFTPKGWEVYPIWYYTSSDEAEVFYTLNFYN